MKLVNPSDKIMFGNVSTSRRELIDLIKAWVAISVAFGIILNGSLFSLGFIITFIIASLSVGLGFIAHELAHKIVAQRYGCFAEFRAWGNMLILAIVMSFFGLILAAPGAVMISGPVGKSRNGKISAAGAIANLIVAGLFLLLLFIPVTGILYAIARYGFMINTWLALFNMIPVWMFDGKKILRWSKTVYFMMVAVGILFMMLQGVIFG
ncbi:MAG: hypothetical protein U9O94_01735 [Nanoarchaeota archaeon]|nr:hypothetical protein [Nanoarchaeota archaeon]